MSKRKYEGVIVLKMEGKEESMDDTVTAISKVIEDEGGKLDQIDRIGRKEFVYETPTHLKAGYYVNYHFEADPEVISKIDTRLKLDKSVHLQHYQRKD